MQYSFDEEREDTLSEMENTAVFLVSVSITTTL
jgi:hypothetical protein